MKCRYLIFLIMFTIAGQANATVFKIDETQSLFGAVIYKAGLGAALAHNHLVFSRSPKVESFEIADGQPLESGKFKAVVNTALLRSDDWGVSQKWNSLLSDWGVIDADTELSQISESDREKIDEKMLSDEQLDAKKFPTLSVQVIQLSPQEGTVGKLKTTHQALLEFQIHGVSKRVTSPVRIERSGDVLSVDVVAELKFTDFGIEPISAVLGTVRNKDEFRVVVHLAAAK